MVLINTFLSATWPQAVSTVVCGGGNCHVAASCLFFVCYGDIQEDPKSKPFGGNSLCCVALTAESYLCHTVQCRPLDVV